ncbi:MAG: J domain-containing protein [Deltaproteobacteria bacterium]|nr:J domain-containing protein [Deltaproteobacteria bacterium]
MSASDDIEGLGPKKTKPLLNPKADLRAVKLSPTEGFVMSRVDGHTSYAEICNVTGLGAAGTIEILRKLKQAGLIYNPGETPRSPPPAQAPASPKPKTPVPPGQTVLARLDDGSAVDPADLIDGPDLEITLKTRLIRAARLLPKLAPHELLGVSPTADHKALKKAYFVASKELHPDRFYGKNLGMFRTLLERLFRAITDAYEQLDQTNTKPGGKPRG